MTPEEQNEAIRAAFANDDYLPQEPELKQALDKYILVQPKGTVKFNEASTLIGAYSQ